MMQEHFHYPLAMKFALSIVNDDKKSYLFKTLLNGFTEQQISHYISKSFEKTYDAIGNICPIAASVYSDALGSYDHKTECYESAIEAGEYLCTAIFGE